MKLGFICLALCLTGCMFAVAANEANDQPGNAIAVTVKQLLEKPEVYNGKLVRVSGYWIRGYEWSYFTANADDLTSDIWLTAHFMRRGSPLSSEMEKKFIAAGMAWPRMNTRVWIDFEGQFEHQALKPTGKEPPLTPSGFGHLSHYSSQLSVSKVIELRPISDLEHAGPR